MPKDGSRNISVLIILAAMVSVETTAGSIETLRQWQCRTSMSIFDGDARRDVGEGSREWACLV